MAQTCEVLLTEANAALERGAWSEARQAFEAALAEEHSPEALFGLATATWWLGDMPRVVAQLEDAYAGFHKRPEPAYAAATAIRLAFHHGLHLGNAAAAAGWASRARRLVQAHQLDSLEGELMLTSSCLAIDPVQAASLAEQALEIGRRTRDPDLELCALGQLGASLVEQGRVSEGCALLDEAMAACLGGEPQRIDTVAFTSCVTMVSCARCADFERATQWLRATERFAERHGSPFHRVECRVVLGHLLIAKGDWARAEETLKATLEMSRSVLPNHYAEALLALAELRLLQGRPEEARRLLSGIANARDSAAVLAALELQQGNCALAAALIERRLETIGAESLEGGRLLELLGEAELCLGRPEPAALRGGGLAQLGTSLGCKVLAARGYRLRGRAAPAGDAEGRRDLDRALRSFSELGMPYEAARTRLFLAEALRAVQPELARTEARLALSSFEELGAVAAADASAALLRALGAPVHRGGRGERAVDALTKREREVLVLLGEGCSNPEIAKRLFVSRKTVEHHVAHILEKLGLKNRAEAAAEAVRVSLR
jgi:ATP/maltotriose-dependent transcriptional regulator MalT